MRSLKARPTPPKARKSSEAPELELYHRIATILDESRSRVARTVNTAMVHAYWLVGREIVEVQQHGKNRAAYGDGLMKRVATRLAARFGHGFSLAGLKRMKQFYLSFPHGSALVAANTGKGAAVLSLFKSASKGSTPLSLSLFPPTLAWTHYLALMRVQNKHARAFYEIEASSEAWSARELERQIASLLFERISINQGERKVMQLARDGQTVVTPTDVFKDPFVLEFLNLKENTTALERDLEEAIIGRLEEFLREMGKGFCFVGRQKRITLEGDHFYVDLVFYNRLLKCFVLVDLKLGKLTHQDLGQMQMYVHYFDKFQRADHEAKTIGIVLCSEKNDAMVKITLPDDNQQILATRYQMYLPTEDELKIELERGREEAERVLRLTDDQTTSAPSNTPSHVSGGGLA